jgi:signal transduction histidine kinase
MTLSRLKWIAILGPLVLLSGVWALIHTEFYDLHDFPGVLVLFAVAAAGIAIFSFSVFELVSRLEAQILEQNRELERRNEELAALLAVGRAASSSFELDDVLAEGMDATLAVTSADAAELWLMTDGELVLAGHRGASAAEFAERTRLRVGEGLPGLAAERGEPTLASDLPSDPRFLRGNVKTAGFRTYCAVPLQHRGETVGVLGVAARDPRNVCADDQLRLLRGIGERLAAAIENAQLHTRVLDGAVIDERVRIARELHDGLAQVLTYITAQTLAVRKLVADGRTEDAQRQLGAMADAVKSVYADVREEILGLRASSNGPARLVPTLRRYVEDYGRLASLSVRLEADSEAESLDLPGSVEIQLMRIAQEALRNIRKHAQAEHATVRIVVDDGHLDLEVMDDGRGFDAGDTACTGWPRFGLQTMHERAAALGGSFEVASVPGAGTTISVEVPLAMEVGNARVAR